MSRSVLITGGGRGIGQAVALLAGERGWSVTINYRGDEAAALRTAEEVEGRGGKAAIVAGDVSREEDVTTMFAAAEERFGPLSGLVNNAGIVAPAMTLADMDIDRLRRMFEVNVLGAYLCAREAARRMSRSRGGTGGAIVNVSSAASRIGSPNEFVDYAGSKGAVDSMTLGLSKELAPEGIRVNAVRPGLIDTDIHAAAGAPDRAARLGAMTPMGRAGTAGEVAEAIIWLLDDTVSSYVTGALLDVAGGR